MAGYTLEFERPILELQAKIEELKQLGQEEQAGFGSEITRLERKVARLQEEVFANFLVGLVCGALRPIFLHHHSGREQNSSRL